MLVRWLRSIKLRLEIARIAIDMEKGYQGINLWPIFHEKLLEDVDRGKRHIDNARIEMDTIQKMRDKIYEYSKLDGEVLHPPFGSDLKSKKPYFRVLAEDYVR